MIQTSATECWSQRQPSSHLQLSEIFPRASMSPEFRKNSENPFTIRRRTLVNCPWLNQERHKFQWVFFCLRRIYWSIFRTDILSSQIFSYSRKIATWIAETYTISMRLTSRFILKHLTCINFLFLLPLSRINIEIISLCLTFFLEVSKIVSRHQRIVLRYQRR